MATKRAHVLAEVLLDHLKLLARLNLAQESHSELIKQAQLFCVIKHLIRKQLEHLVGELIWALLIATSLLRFDPLRVCFTGAARPLWLWLAMRTGIRVGLSSGRG